MSEATFASKLINLETPSERLDLAVPIWRSGICQETFRHYRWASTGILHRHTFSYSGIDGDHDSEASWSDLPANCKPQAHVLTDHGELLLALPGGQLFCSQPAESMPNLLNLGAPERLGEHLHTFRAAVIQQTNFGGYPSIDGVLIGGSLQGRAVIILGDRSKADNWRLLQLPEEIGTIISMVYCGGHSMIKVLPEKTGDYMNQLWQVKNIHLPNLLGHSIYTNEE
jgi:hypothetical protein